MFEKLFNRNPKEEVSGGEINTPASSHDLMDYVKLFDDKFTNTDDNEIMNTRHNFLAEIKDILTLPEDMQGEEINTVIKKYGLSE